MQALIILLFFIYIFSINVNIFIVNLKNTTKIHIKIWFIRINIPYQKIISKSLIKEKNKKIIEKINDLLKFMSAKDFIYYFCKYSVIEEIYLQKYEDMHNEEINIFQNTLILSLFYRISGIINNTFKQIYSEYYQILYNPKRKDEIDGYINIKNNIFGIMYAYLVYYVKKRSTIKWRIQ